MHTLLTYPHSIQLFFQWLIALDAKDHAEPSGATAVKASEDSQGGFNVIDCEALIYMTALEIPLAVQMNFLSQSF